MKSSVKSHNQMLENINSHVWLISEHQAALVMSHTITLPPTCLQFRLRGTPTATSTAAPVKVAASDVQTVFLHRSLSLSL